MFDALCCPGSKGYKIMTKYFKKKTLTNTKTCDTMWSQSKNNMIVPHLLNRIIFYQE